LQENLILFFCICNLKHRIYAPHNSISSSLETTLSDFLVAKKKNKENKVDYLTFQGVALSHHCLSYHYASLHNVLFFDLPSNFVGELYH